jgi:hypothetical protein
MQSIQKYKVRVKHDKGTVAIYVHATDADTAKRLVISAEKCPERSILSVSLEPSRKEKERLRQHWSYTNLKFMANGEVYARSWIGQPWGVLLTARQLEDTLRLWRDENASF